MQEFSIICDLISMQSIMLKYGLMVSYESDFGTILLKYFIDSCNASILFAWTWIWSALGICILQQISQ